jgi:cell division protein FtsB
MQWLLLKRFDWPVTLGCLVLLAYMAVHAFYGNRGYQHLTNLGVANVELQQELNTLSQRRADLETKVSLLRPERVDPDLLEELAREQMELARPNDLIVKLKP